MGVVGFFDRVLFGTRRQNRRGEDPFYRKEAQRKEGSGDPLSRHHDWATSNGGPNKDWNVLRLRRRRHHDAYHLIAGNRTFAEFADLLEAAHRIREGQALLDARAPRHLRSLLDPEARHRAAYRNVFGKRSFADAARVCRRVAARIAIRRELFEDTTATFIFVPSGARNRWLVVPRPRDLSVPIPAGA